MLFFSIKPFSFYLYLLVLSLFCLLFHFKYFSLLPLLLFLQAYQFCLLFLNNLFSDVVLVEELLLNSGLLFSEFFQILLSPLKLFLIMFFDSLFS